MAKVKFGAVVADARGKLDGIVYSRNQFGAYIRNKVTPVNPGTPFQAAARQLLNDLAVTYTNILTQAQRDGWFSFAQTHPVTDVFGASQTLTAIAMFTRLNSVIVNAGAAVILTAPANLDVGTLSTMSITTDIGLGTMEITFTPTPTGANDKLYIFATPSLPLGKAFVTPLLRFIGVTAAAAVSPVGYESLYLARFGALPIVGTDIVVEAAVVRTTNGALSTRRKARGLVVST